MAEFDVDCSGELTVNELKAALNSAVRTFGTSSLVNAGNVADQIEQLLWDVC